MMDEAQKRALDILNGKRPRAKYRNKKVVVGGEIFDSVKEFNRWVYLTALQASGKIYDLKRQERFPLCVKDVESCEFVEICTYVADFSYIINDPLGVTCVVEDVKAVGEKIKGKRRFTTKTPVYEIKKKLLKALHGIEIVEV